MKHFYQLLTIGVLALSANLSAQSEYAVTAIPYQVYTADAETLATDDDFFSNNIGLGFDFDFYGSTFSQAIVGTNGVLSFDLANAGNFCPWNFASTIPDAGFPIKNAVLGVYEDLNNETDFGSITYAVTGVAPYRKFVLMFNNQPHYECNQSVISSSEIILYETLNIIDVQVTDRNVCPNWQGGVGVLGIISADGSAGLAAPGRNTGAWTAHHEGWRFARPFSADEYHYIICATGAVGTYSLDVPRNDLSPGNPSAVSFYTSEANAVSQVNPIADSFYVSGTTGTLYANVDGAIRHIVLGMVDCTNDYDGDSVATNDEDINADGNLANDDTDGDGIWNFIDNDDDGDMVLTSFEYAFAGKSAATAALTDTDGDGVPNYLDNDDDGDGVLTINEDYNGNHDPADDDTNLDGTPDYLQNTVALGVAQQQSASLSLYPNPVSGVLHVSGIENGKAEIYSVTGALVKTADASDISVSELQSGLYFIRITSNGITHTSKFIKQ